MLKNFLYNTSFSYKFCGSYIKRPDTKNIFKKMFSTKEIAMFQLFKNNVPADFVFCCKVIFALQKISNSENFSTYISGRNENGKVFRMSENYHDFCCQVKDITSCNISFVVGDEKIPFCIETGLFTGNINVGCSIYHPENVSSIAIIDILKHKIAEVLKYLETIEILSQNENFSLTNFKLCDKIYIQKRNIL